MSHKIEVSVDLKVVANLAFWIEKDRWEAMSEEEQQNEILRQIETVNEELSRDVIHFDTANISAVIMGPDGKEYPFEPGMIQLYDPEA